MVRTPPSLSLVLLRSPNSSTILTQPQGCCSSLPTFLAPYPTSPTPPQNSSRTAINSTTTAPRPSTTHSSHTHHRRPLAEHFNLPLHQHTWTSPQPQPRIWTRRELDRERIVFFETRVSGRAEVWAAIQAAVEEARRPGGEGLATAQTILDAADVTLPTGDLADGVYDALGGFYAVPEWVACEPADVVEGDGDGEQDVGVRGETEEEGVRREEKGKGKVLVVEEGPVVKVKVRLSERGGIDVVVRVGREESVRGVTRRVLERSDVCPIFPFSFLLSAHGLPRLDFGDKIDANVICIACGGQTSQDRVSGQDSAGE